MENIYHVFMDFQNQCRLYSVHSSSALVLNCLYVFVLLLVAVERNNLMRLSQSIPFTPVTLRGKSGSQHSVRHVWSGENPADTSEKQELDNSWKMRTFCGR